MHACMHTHTQKHTHTCPCTHSWTCSHAWRGKTDYRGTGKGVTNQAVNKLFVTKCAGCIKSYMPGWQNVMQCLLSLLFVLTCLCLLPTDRLLFVNFQTVGLGGEHASILLFCKTWQLVQPVWGEIVLKEEELDSQEGRLALFSQLLAATSLASGYSALCQLLQLWPHFTEQWVCVWVWVCVCVYLCGCGCVYMYGFVHACLFI